MSFNTEWQRWGNVLLDPQDPNHYFDPETGNYGYFYPSIQTLAAAALGELINSGELANQRPQGEATESFKLTNLVAESINTHRSPLFVECDSRLSSLQYLHEAARQIDHNFTVITPDENDWQGYSIAPLHANPVIYPLARGETAEKHILDLAGQLKDRRRAAEPAFLLIDDLPTLNEQLDHTSKLNLHWILDRIRKESKPSVLVVATYYGEIGTLGRVLLPFDQNHHFKLA